MTRPILNCLLTCLAMVLAWMLLCAGAASLAGCSHLPFTSGGGHPLPKPSSNPSQHALSLAIYGGLAMAFAGILVAIIAGRVKSGLLLIGAGIAVWALADFLRQYQQIIVIAAGCLALAAVAWGAWEAWQHRKTLAETVQGFNEVKAEAPELWGKVKTILPAKSEAAERVMERMGA